MSKQFHTMCELPVQITRMQQYSSPVLLADLPHPNPFLVSEKKKPKKPTKKKNLCVHLLGSFLFIV